MAGTLRLGIIGLGTQGSIYAQQITDGLVEGLVVGAIADVDPAKADVAASRYPDVPFFDDYVKLLDSGTVDAVVTTVPHYLHPQIGIEALRRDLHVLIEKPAGVYTKQVAELNAYAATKPSVAFGIMLNQRNNPLYQRLKEIVANGEIGAIRRSNWIITTWWRTQPYYDQSAWRATWGGEGGGVLVNQAPHQLDLWQWICGVPKTVYAKVAYGFRRDIAVEDEVTALADYGDGVTGVFVTATHDMIGTDRFEILGDAGKIVVENSTTATVTRFKLPERVLASAEHAADLANLTSGGVDSHDNYTQEVINTDSAWGNQHVGVLQNFTDHILHGAPLFSSGAEGMTGVRLANAIHLSSWLGKEVPLDFDEDEFLALLNERIRDEALYPERS
ncbi:Gfo/Idh/MocA family protein [Promicromonospora sp. Populi]|uniref:Gfo/Idh/MocA family protein n=1 Tax=Promicromonospora sp. Populi TaxID=3239420 RepID=UPI0034E2A67F